MAAKQRSVHTYAMAIKLRTYAPLFKHLRLVLLGSQPYGEQTPQLLAMRYGNSTQPRMHALLLVVMYSGWQMCVVPGACQTTVSTCVRCNSRRHALTMVF